MSGGYYDRIFHPPLIAMNNLNDELIFEWRLEELYQRLDDLEVAKAPPTARL